MKMTEKFQRIPNTSFFIFNGVMFNLKRDGTMYMFPYKPNYRQNGKPRFIKQRPNAGNGYVYYHIIVNGKSAIATVHRMLAFIYLEDFNDDLEVHHVDGDLANNTLGNLRMASKSDNHLGYRRKARGVSKYRGVTFIKKTGRWRARLKKGGKFHWGGEHNNEIDAAKAYNKLAIEHGFDAGALNKIP